MFPVVKVCLRDSCKPGLECKEPEEQPIEVVKALQAEMNKLKAELRRATEDRDILKKAAAYFAKVSE
jgi:transposase-like protein